MRGWATTATVLGAMLPGVATAAEFAPATERPSSSRPSGDFRVRTIARDEHPELRVGDPRSPLRRGYGGSMIDLFPFAGGKFHLSAGSKLFGRAGRPRASVVESQRLLPGFRGPGRGRRFSPAMLVGYGGTVDRGMALGVDAGVVMGRITPGGDRLGHLNREQLPSGVWRGRRDRVNEIARVTALYRF